MTSSVALPMRYASRRAFEVWWTGFLLLVFWIVLISVGPYIESRWAPVIDDFHIMEIENTDRDIIRFRPAFNKNRQCTYLGMQWFVKDDLGRFSRHQVLTSDKLRAPMTYPTGLVIGDWWEVGTRDSDREMYGVMHHACGLPWESRSIVGPFSVSHTKTGKVSLSPTRLANR